MSVPPLPPVLECALSTYSESDRARLVTAIEAGFQTAERISWIMSELGGRSVSASTIRTYRRQLKLAQAVERTRTQ